MILESLTDDDKALAEDKISEKEELNFMPSSIIIKMVNHNYKPINDTSKNL